MSSSESEFTELEYSGNEGADDTVSLPSDDSDDSESDTDQASNKEDPLIKREWK